MMISPETYFKYNILWKNKKELNKEICIIKEEIQMINEKIKAGKESVEKPSLFTIIKSLISYYHYINTYFIKNVILSDSDVDSFWKDIASNFVVTCIECNDDVVSIIN